MGWMAVGSFTTQSRLEMSAALKRSGQFLPLVPDSTGAKTFRECGERFVLGEKHLQQLKPQPSSWLG